MLWLSILDQALEWLDPAGLPVEGAGRIRLAAALLHRVCASQLIQRDLEEQDERALYQWLKDVTITASLDDKNQVTDRLTTLDRTSLRVRRKKAALPEPHETLLSTALVQFLAGWRPSLVSVISRCHGIRRGPRPATGLPADWEEEFVRRAGLSALLREPGLHQCSRIVWNERGSRFCSKACSNATFAARKALEEPRYFAEKQERYRSRQEKKKKKPRRDPGAFVYMD